MTDDELNAMTMDDLVALIESAKVIYKRRRAERRTALKRGFEAKLKAEGFSLDEVLGDLSKSNAKNERKSMPPKYRHPEKPQVTWSGLGRKPSWLQELLSEGTSLEELRITG